MLKTETKHEKQERIRKKSKYDKEYREREKNKPWWKARAKLQHEKYRDARGKWDKKYRKNNKKSIAVSNKKWITKKGKAYRAAISSKRRGVKANAILPSTNFKKIKKIHKQCQKLSKTTGVEHHVDHMIPLTIGGAHHQSNLRIITAEENLRKNNTYLVELGGVWADNELAKKNKP